MSLTENDIVALIYRLEEIEHRLNHIEKSMNLTPPAFHPAVVSPPQTSNKKIQPAPSKNIDITNIMGIGGVSAVFLAAVYFVSLGIQNGWLTPPLQILVTFVFGCFMIAGGFALEGSKKYASLLPAGGLTIQYLAIFGAHLKYHMIPAEVAYVGIGAVTSLGLWLCRRFAYDIYAYVALAGCYLLPLLIRNESRSLIEPGVYFLAWGCLFCGYSIIARLRSVYVAAAYCSLIAFDFLWLHGQENWRLFASFQFLYFALFASAAVVYSIRNKSPMTYDQAIGHIPVLLLYYGMQYGALSANTNYAPWISLLSAGVVWTMYFVAKDLLKGSLKGSQIIATTYSAVVFLHAGWMTLIPAEYSPLASIPVIAGCFVYFQSKRFEMKTGWPIAALGLIVFIVSNIRLFFHGQSGGEIRGADLLIILYALIPYSAFAFALARNSIRKQLLLLLYIGHINAMAAAVQLSSDRLSVSFIWATIAFVTMGIGYRVRRLHVAQSSVVVFAACCLKLLLYDLSGTTPLIRIGCLMVLGSSLYAGGWLLAKIRSLSETPKNSA
jgi:hypothetical protein